MTFTIELPDDERDELLAVAERYGVEPHQAASRLVEFGLLRCPNATRVEERSG